MGANNEDFWREVEHEIDRAYLLQQVIFPASNIHSDETIVSPFSSELMLAHEMLSGDVSFSHVDEVNMLQVEEFAKSYLKAGEPPDIAFDIDDILDGERNGWLRDMHITVNADYSVFADRIRAHRDATASEFVPLLDKWAAEKPTFEAVLNSELKSFGTANRSALVFAVERASRAFETSDAMAFFEKLSHPVMEQFKRLRAFFEERGVPTSESAKTVSDFWDWPGNEQLPVHKISAYMFAALARKIASGQKRRPTKGMFNDINAIATYGPYVDAMFLDNECAQMLSEYPLSSDLNIRAKIFSTRSGDAFLEYLRSLQSAASPLVCRKAAEIYGVT